MKRAGHLVGQVVNVSANGKRNRLLEFTSDRCGDDGQHSGQAAVSLCQDAACATPQATPSPLVNYGVNVLAPGSAWPGNHP